MTFSAAIRSSALRLRRAYNLTKFLFKGMPVGLRAPDSFNEAELQSVFLAYKLRGSVKSLSVPLAKRILVIAPHPDDETIGCGGLILRHANTAEMRLVCIYNGDTGGSVEAREGEIESDYRARLAQTRSEELRANAKALNFSQTFELGVSEFGNGPTHAEIAKIRDILLEFRPEVVVLPWVFDSHPHHRIANRLVASASAGIDFMALGYEVWGSLPENCYLDITDVIERKLSLVTNYVSQSYSVDYASYCEALAKVRAFQRPVRPMRRGAVEAYHMLPGWQFRQVVLGQDATN